MKKIPEDPRPGLLGHIRIPPGFPVGPFSFKSRHMIDLMKYKTCAKSRKPALFDCIWGAIERERKRRDWGLVDNELTKSTNERYQKILDMEIDILNALVELETAERTTCRRRYVLENEIFPKRGRLFKMQAELLDEFGS